jgi:hypothetical protein
MIWENYKELFIVEKSPVSTVTGFELDSNQKFLESMMTKGHLYKLNKIGCTTEESKRDP